MTSKEPNQAKRDRVLSFGFTLIELMLVVAIVGLLAAIAIPKFGNLILKAQEAGIKGKLGSVRSALRIYYADNEGMYPYNFVNPVAIFVPKYIQKVPHLNSIPRRHDSSPFWWGGQMVSPTIAYPPVIENNGGYYWLGHRRQSTSAFTMMTVVVGCLHPDSTGRNWSTW